MVLRTGDERLLCELLLILGFITSIGHVSNLARAEGLARMSGAKWPNFTWIVVVGVLEVLRGVKVFHHGVRSQTFVMRGSNPFENTL